ncbi:MAG TPA: four-helix bundle copper-binding protein [Isosphaeraceae bacterium]|jgi:hypothetical protein|nr:four-helix bundle copper-binding protein [Isosphaeraceae bacterium]
MDRREWLGMLGVGAVGAAALAGGEAKADHHAHSEKNHTDCIKACNECTEECNKTFDHCFEMVESGQAKHARAARITNDCAAFCALAAQLIGREGPLMVQACHACVEACELCASECEKIASPQMKQCAKACRECARTCREMATTTRA